MLWRSTIRLGRFLLAWVYVLVVCIAACIMVVLAGPTRMWLFMLPRWAKGTLKVVGITLRIDGAEHLAGPGIFVSNHTSLIDVVILPAIVPPTTKVVAKRELIYVPFLGWAFGASGAVLVDRRNARAAVASMRAALAKLPAGWSIAVFPEGTRSRTASMRPFKKGAFHMAVATGLPIIPVGLDGAQQVSPPGKWLVRGGEVRICVGAPISTAGWRNGQLAEPMQATRDAVQRCIDHAVAMRGDPQP